MALITFDDKDSSLPSGSANPRKKIRDVDVNEIKSVVNANANGQAAAISAAVVSLIDGAPGALDTLNEIAAAIGNDANFAATVSAALNGKQATLVSGTNIKTVNSISIVGSGNIPLVDDTIDDAVTTRAPSQNAVFDALALKATIAYVDDVASGLVSGWKAPCDTASTANLTLSGEQTIDGVLTSASRVLVKNQTAPAENGIYTTAAGAWSRSTDSNTAIELEGAAVTVSAGTTQANTTWVQTSDNITLETTAIAWSQLGTSVQDASSSVKGVARLYPSTSLGSNTDGAPDQNAVKVYADAKVADAINNGTTTIAPSQNAVFDALALKSPLDSPVFTTLITTPLVKITGGSPGAGKVLTSDADGDGSWATPSVTVANITGVLPIANGGNGTTTGISNETQTALNLKTTSTNFAKRVTLVGTQNGSNTVFTVGQSMVAGSDELFRNGLLMTEAVDYTLATPTGTPTITFTVAPESWEIIRINYIRP